MSGSLGTCISRLTGVYRDPQRVLRDAETLLSSPLGTHLRPTTEPLMLNDGSATPPVLLLRGTLPMTYRGVTYNLPIDMYLPPPYPQRPPTVFIRPVASMAIKENHRHVGLDGRVYLPYLHEWRANTHELRELAVWMSSLFGDQPPCYAKPANASTRSSTVSNGSSSVASNGHGNHHNPPPAYSQAAVASTSSHSSAAYNSSTSTYASNTSSATNNAEEERRRAYEKQIADATAASLAAETARQAAAEEARVLAEEKRLQREHEQNLTSMRIMATSKVQSEMQTLFRGIKDELRIELQDQKKLEHGKVQIEKLIKEGRERRVQLTKGNKEMDESIEKLEQWLKAVKEHQSTSSTTAGTSENDETSKADLIALPEDTHSAQMLALSAENAPIDDCIYFLDQALVRGSIGLDVFLKEVRRLSKRQFLAKVCFFIFQC